MEEIKLGEYVRTDKGRIQKIKYFSDFAKKTDENGNIVDYEYVFHTGYCSFHIEYIEMEKIVKHSPEIIDLIEVDDYVNGYRVIKKLNNSLLYTNSIEELMLYNSFAPNGVQHYQPIIITEDEIKSIVTKEMMKSVEYIIEED